MLKQKSFQVNENEWNLLFDIAKSENKSASEIIRQLIRNFISEKETENINLFLKKHCDYVSENEEQEITKTLKSKKSYKFQEVSLNDLQN